jgi:hypothetical protein
MFCSLIVALLSSFYLFAFPAVGRSSIQGKAELTTKISIILEVFLILKICFCYSFDLKKYEKIIILINIYILKITCSIISNPQNNPIFQAFFRLIF